MGIDLVKARGRTLADRVLDNVSRGFPPNVGAEARALGYSENSIKGAAPQRTVAYKARIMERIERANVKAVKLLEKRRLEALEAMPDRMKKAGYRDLAYATDILTKNHRLLTNQSTENVENKGSVVMLPASNSDDTDIQNVNTEKTA